MNKKYCVIILCCMDCKKLLDVIFTDDYKSSLYDYYLCIENDGDDCNDYVIVYDCIKGVGLCEGYVDNLMYKDLEVK